MVGNVSTVQKIVASAGGELQLPLECRSDKNSVHSRSQQFERGWITNNEGVRVAWVVFNCGIYQSIRFLRSSYVFDREDLQVKLDAFNAKNKQAG